MKLKKLGSSDLEVPIVCLGTMTFGEQCSEEMAWEIMDAALAAGCNFFDTAELYPVPPTPETCGRTEEIIGRWMAARGCRDKIVLATKVASFGRAFVAANRTVPPDPNPPANTRLEAQQIRAAIEASLRRLQTDHVELYQLHWPDRYAPTFGLNQYRPENERDAVAIDEQMACVGELICEVACMGELLKEGKVKHWGLSNETTFGVCQFVEAARRLGVPPPITIQNDFCLMDRRFEGHLAEACAPRNYNISLLPYGPLAGGTLTDKYHFGNEPGPKARHMLFPEFQPRYHSTRSRAAAAKYAELAKRKGLTTAQLALAWCASRWYVGSTIIGANSLEQVKENLSAFEIEIDEATLKDVDALHLEHRNPDVTD